MSVSEARICLLLATLASIVIIGMGSTFGYGWPAEFVGVSAAIAGLSVVVALARGGFQHYPFWITMIAAYPVITPFVVVSLLGFPYFSGRAQELQDPQVLAAPMLLASLACLYLSIAVSSKRIDIGRRTAPWSNSASSGQLAWLVITSILVMGSAWLTEPGPPVWLVPYAEMMTYRFPGTDFAGAGWAVASVINLALYLSLRGGRCKNLRRLSTTVFWGTTLVSIIYLLAHARRSEVAGYIVLLLCVFGPTSRSTTKGLLLFAGLAALSAVGYLRESTTLADYLASDYIHLPGGAGNVLIGYIAAFTLIDSSALSLVPGETYVGYILRLPPSVLGLERPPTAYDYVHAQVPLSGGEYFLIEPLLNFGAIGVILYLTGFVAMTNWSVSVISRYEGTFKSIGQFVLAGTFLALQFRTLWYGLGAVIKALILAAGLVFVAYVVVQGVRQWRNQWFNAHGGSGQLEVEQTKYVR